MQRAAPAEDLVKYIRKYYDNPDFSDVTVRWSGREINAHRVILCSQSEYFKTALAPDSPFRESQNGVIELFEDDAAAVGHLFYWLYHRKYHGNSTLLENLEVIMIADKYAVPDLENEATKALEPYITCRCSTSELLEVMQKTMKYHHSDGKVARMLSAAMSARFADTYSSDGLLQAWLDHNPIVAAELYKDNYTILLANPDFVAKLKEDPTLRLLNPNLLNETFGEDWMLSEGPCISRSDESLGDSPKSADDTWAWFGWDARGFQCLS